jgi:hypothetical protein
MQWVSVDPDVVNRTTLGFKPRVAEFVDWMSTPVFVIAVITGIQAI